MEAFDSTASSALAHSSLDVRHLREATSSGKDGHLNVDTAVQDLGGSSEGSGVHTFNLTTLT